MRQHQSLRNLIEAIPEHVKGGEEEGRLTVSFTVVESAPTPGETTNETQPVPANLRATGAPTIVGTAQAGETLTVDTSGIADEDGLEDATFSYQWVRNDGATGTNIEDATGSSYTLTEDDEGKAIKVQVTFTDAAGNQETLTSTETAAVEPAPNSEATGAPTIGGTARLGETLTADTSAIADEDGLDSAVFSYRWIRNDGTEDAEIADATGVDYTLVQDDVGKTITVRVSFTDGAGREESLTSPPTAAVSAAPDRHPGQRAGLP